MRDWVATDRSIYGESSFRQAWRSLIALLPCLGFLWMAWRHPFGRPEAWPPASAAVTILGVFSLWYLGYTFLDRLTGWWLHRLISEGVNSVEVVDFDSRLGLTLRDAGLNAFLLVALGIAALAPTYFRYIEGCFSRTITITSAPQTGFRRRIKKILLAGQIGWGLLWGAFFAAAVAWSTRYRWDNVMKSWLQSVLPQYLSFDAGQQNSF